MRTSRKLSIAFLVSAVFAIAPLGALADHDPGPPAPEVSSIAIFEQHIIDRAPDLAPALASCKTLKCHETEARSALLKVSVGDQGKQKLHKKRTFVFADMLFIAEAKAEDAPAPLASPAAKLAELGKKAEGLADKIPLEGVVYVFLAGVIDLILRRVKSPVALGVIHGIGGLLMGVGKLAQGAGSLVYKLGLASDKLLGNKTGPLGA